MNISPSMIVELSVTDVTFDEALQCCSCGYTVVTLFSSPHNSLMCDDRFWMSISSIGGCCWFCWKEEDAIAVLVCVEV